LRHFFTSLSISILPVLAIEIKNFPSITSRLHKKSFYINIFQENSCVRLHAGYIKMYENTLPPAARGTLFYQRWQVQVTGAGEEMGKILRNKTTSNRVGAPHPRPPGPPTKAFDSYF